MVKSLKHELHWKIVNVVIDNSECSFIVAEHSNGFWKTYWIDCGNIINAIFIENKNMIVGVGARKYENQIREAVSKFTCRDYLNRSDWQNKNKEKIKVIINKDKECDNSEVH